MLVGLGFAGYFLYQNYYYYQTDNAKVDTTIYKLPANASGKLVKVYVSEGRTGQKAGQTLARVVHGSFIQSPTDGTVIDVKFHEGDYVNPSDIVVVVAETPDIYITANVESNEMNEVYSTHWLTAPCGTGARPRRAGSVASRRASGQDTERPIA